MDLIIAMPSADSAGAVADLSYTDEQLPGTRDWLGNKLVMCNTQLDLLSIEALYPANWLTMIAQGEQVQSYTYQSVNLGDYAPIIRAEPLASLLEYAADMPGGGRPTITQVVEVLRFRFQGREPMQDLIAWAVQIITTLNPLTDFEGNGVPKVSAIEAALGVTVTQADIDAAWAKIQTLLGN